MIAEATRSYPYVAIDVAEEEAEEAAGLLFEQGAQGVEQRDESTLARGPAAGKVTLIASFERAEEARAATTALPSAWSPRVETVVGDAWRDEWKKHFAPFRLAGAIVVSPPWCSYEALAGETVIILEPGRAFGTGLHETTSLVAQMLSDHAARFRGLPVLDVGCGSGILSLASLALGAASARAVDVDSEAVQVTRENAARNRLGVRIHADQAPLEAVAGCYAAVVANIEAATLIEIAPALMKRVAPQGLLILSGILAPHVAPSQIEDVLRAYSELSRREVRSKGEWSAALLEA